MVLIICVSKEHGNTRRLADAIAQELDGKVVGPEDIDAASLSEYKLIGFGSGIRYGRHYVELLELVDGLPEQPGKRAFIFSTSGFGWKWWHRALRRRLASKGFDVGSEFCCKGLDTMGPLQWFGGVNKGRPNDQDLASAKEFARRLLQG